MMTTTKARKATMISPSAANHRVSDNPVLRNPGVQEALNKCVFAKRKGPRSRLIGIGAL